MKSQKSSIHATSKTLWSQSIILGLHFLLACVFGRAKTIEHQATGEAFSEHTLSEVERLGVSSKRKWAGLVEKEKSRGASLSNKENEATNRKGK